jgi:hypothetical protein
MADLEYLAARLSLDILEHEEILQVVEGVADPSKYPDMLVDYVGTGDALERALSSFRAYLKDKGIDIPNREEAVWAIIYRHLSRIASGEVSPAHGLRSLKLDIWDFLLTEAPNQKFVGDIYGVETLMGMYWARDDLLDDLDEEDLTEELRNAREQTWPRDVRKAAEEWLGTYGERFGQPLSKP